MSAQADRNELPPAKRRRLLGLRLLRALATTVVLVALYYLLPLDHIKNVPLTLAGGLLSLLAVTIWQVRAIIRARYPALRTVEALAATVPLFLLLFASAYFTMARTNPASFSTHSLTRTDALYFTVTAFSTVGFGDITAVSQPASQARGHRAVAARPGAQGGDLARPLAPNHTGPSHRERTVSARRSCDFTVAAARSAATSPP